jgi:hypothetical protein
MSEAYLIEYFRDGTRIAGSTWPAQLEIAKQIARDGITRYRADFVRIVNADLSGPEIWSEKSAPEGSQVQMGIGFHASH